jgi:metallo-beta-lactamase family protein
VRTIDGYSAHADHNELLSYVSRVIGNGRLRRVFCVHGDLDACQAMAEGIRGLGVQDVLVPQPGQQVEL